MSNETDTRTVILDQLVYTWAERTLTGTGNGVVLRSSQWPTGISAATDAALADFVEYIPARLQHRLSGGLTPPLGADFWEHPEYGNVVSVHRYLGVDSAGRGGRSIIHVLLDRERRLDALSAMDLCRSQLIATEWDLNSDPVHDMDAVRFIPGQRLEQLPQLDAQLLIMTMSGILENILHGRQIVFTHEQEVDALGLLETCLRILPRSLAKKVTFSTYRGIPQRSKFAVSFASTIFSEVLPKADLQKTYVPLPESDTGQPAAEAIAASISPAAVNAATELLRLREIGSICPPDVSSFVGLEQWISHHRLAVGPSELLDLAGCTALLALPSDTGWVHRDHIIRRAAQIVAGTTQKPTFLGLLTASEKEYFGLALHSQAVAAISSSPSLALNAKHQADALGYPAQRLAELAIPGLDALPLEQPTDNPALAQFISEIAAFLPLSVRVGWVSAGPLFRDALLKEWEPTSRAVATQTWTQPRWARAHSTPAKSVALLHPVSSAGIVAKALADHTASSAAIDSVLEADHEFGDGAFTEVIRRVVKTTPGIPNHHLRRLAECDLLPASILADIKRITDPQKTEKPAFEPAASVRHSAALWPSHEPFQNSMLPQPRQTESAPPQQYSEYRRNTAQEWDHRWQGFAPESSHEPSASARKPWEGTVDQPAIARRRTTVRILAVGFSAVAGYAVAASQWNLIVWPPAVLVLLISVMLTILPIRRQSKPAEKRTSSYRRQRMGVLTGSYSANSLAQSKKGTVNLSRLMRRRSKDSD
ncbi:hypothetical protein [Paenarthrobacter aurescens]|jgi:hypothetical protein|uniref:Uncharacterized protein n=1 Tax=Paenarthrobacter aurescens (strain TC1) TaxID=290340 RepID=A1R9H4_PAEAT|nr:hypothetical protein [Paenarthrobacter aurescens]ABM09520.1 hypothetical protein AAur_3189 [Paenarthrobacter aurescens TC1]